MRTPDQKMRFNNIELGLIKSVFAENDDLLYLVRKVLAQGELTEGERDQLKLSITDPVFEVLRKMLNPEIDPEAPLGQIAHMILGLGADVKTLSPEGAWPFIKAKELEIAYIAQQIEGLQGKEIKPKIKFVDFTNLDGDKEEVYIRVLVFNFLTTYIDSTIHQLKFLAGLKEESVEQTLAKLAKNSNK